MDNIFEGGLRTARGHSGVEGWWGTAHGVWWCGGLRPSLGRGTRAVCHAHDAAVFECCMNGRLHDTRLQKS